MENEYLIFKNMICRKCKCKFTYSIKSEKYDLCKKEFGQEYLNSKTHYCEKCWQKKYVN